MESEQADPETILTPTDTRPGTPCPVGSRAPPREASRTDPVQARSRNSKRRNAKNPRSLPVRIAVRTRQQASAQAYRRTKHRQGPRRPPRNTRRHRRSRLDKKRSGPGLQRAHRSAATSGTRTVALPRPRKIGASPVVHLRAEPSTQEPRPHRALSLTFGVIRAAEMWQGSSIADRTAHMPET